MHKNTQLDTFVCVTLFESSGRREEVDLVNI